MLDGLQRLPDPKACELRLRYVFALIWLSACIDCCLGDDCYLVGLSEGAVRHVVCVPMSMIEYDQGVSLVRAVYKADIPRRLGRAATTLMLSL